MATRRELAGAGAAKEIESAGVGDDAAVESESERDAQEEMIRHRFHGGAGESGSGRDDSQSSASMRQRIHEGLQGRRKRVQSLTDTAWDSLHLEFKRMEEVKEKLTEEFEHRRCELRRSYEAGMSELVHVKEDAKANVRSMWWRASFYVQLLCFVGPVLAYLFYHPDLILYGLMYLLALAVFLLWSLVVPSLNHRGKSWVRRYELSEAEYRAIDDIQDRAAARTDAAQAQGLWRDEESDKPTLVLSLEGGGIKGAVSARVLERVCDEFPGLMDKVDLIAGCSTGTILGGMLATGHTPKESLDLFTLGATMVFRTTVWDQLKNLGMLTGPGHDGQGKYEILSRAFRGKKMSELLKGVCFTACHVHHNKPAPRVWTNVLEQQHTYEGHFAPPEKLPSAGPGGPGGPGGSGSALSSGSGSSSSSGCGSGSGSDSTAAGAAAGDIHLADIVHGATAAPLYFPAYRGYVDGGLWSNDPSMAALAMLAPKRNLQRVCLLSISTGETRADKACEVGSWGLTQWLPWLVDFFFDSTAKAAEFNCIAMLQERYHRINPQLPRPIAMNDVSAVDELVGAADDVDLEPTFRWIEQHIGLPRGPLLDEKDDEDQYDDQHDEDVAPEF